MITELDNRMVRSSELADRELLKVSEAAEICNIHRDTMYQWIKKGVLPHVRVGPSPGLVRLRRSEVRKLQKDENS